MGSPLWRQGAAWFCEGLPAGVGILGTYVFVKNHRRSSSGEAAVMIH